MGYVAAWHARPTGGLARQDDRRGIPFEFLYKALHNSS